MPAKNNLLEKTDASDIIEEIGLATQKANHRLIQTSPELINKTLSDLSTLLKRAV